ncbi:hypothetical protein KSF_090070 [Reticulibacter mediterranei]|uniref:Peptidase A4 family protein n=1 Tax=Reticulibacter mediterranei TaxID=2778369 RepID=A0A8J3IW68_9CHLR|nr:G1 family glutamic endopeptidase [Reticulibacter mediterranei]GHO98959.1 hypothetical protein KSF_090070 [Reticulibacter mediterranei]
MSPPTFLRWRTLIAGLISLLMTIVVIFTPGASSSALTLQNGTNSAAATDTSSNWSGYIATGGNFTSVTGTWIVPQPTASDVSTADAAWVGIGGVKSNDLLQSGTEDMVDRNGQVTFLAFFEMLPNAARPLPVTIQGGDSVTASVTEIAPEQWQIIFKNNSSGQSYARTVQYHSSLSSAEWIEEVPSTGQQLLSLAQFGSVSFSAGSAFQNGNQQTIAQSNAQPVIMVDTQRQPLATPSDLAADGASFTVTRSNVPSSPSQPVRRRHRGWRY